MTNDMNQANLKQLHSREAIRDRLAVGPRHSYLRDWIYGAIDGAVTTFAVVCSVAGAELASSIVIILGTANLIADGFSMAVSNFLGSRAEKQERSLAREDEAREIELFPEGEREEIRQIFARKGFEGDDLDRAVEIITSDVEQWIDTMLVEEHGMTRDGSSSVRAALTTFFAFLVIGALPLAPYAIGAAAGIAAERLFLSSVIMTGVAFFVVGALKSRFIRQSWWISGLETLTVGAVAAGLAYTIGALLKGVA